jgi:hypothetical protein
MSQNQVKMLRQILELSEISHLSRSITWESANPFHIFIGSLLSKGDKPTNVPVNMIL